LSVDPLAADFASVSPYNYVLGNPVILVDPDGREPYLSGTSSKFGSEGEEKDDTIIENEQGEKTYINDGYTFTMQLSNEQYDAVIASANENGGKLAFASLDTDVSWETYVKWVIGGSVNGSAQGLAGAAEYMGALYGPIIGEAMAAGIATILLKGPIKRGTKLNGNWITTNESMSAAAANYQRAITGRAANQSYRLGGVKFDGVRGNILLDAKSGYGNFVTKNNDFYSWFRGANGLVTQARSQLKAANGAPIQWHFQNESVRNATQKLFNNNGIKGIDLIHTPR